MTLDHNKPFVVGNPRSGTSWLTRMKRLLFIQSKDSELGPQRNESYNS